MKQIFAALTALTLLCTLTACGGMADQSASAPSPSDQKELLSESGTSSTPDEREPAAAETPRVLVAYFSATGNTEHIAQYIQTILNADLYEIVPEEPYTDDDLHYSDDNCRANREQNDPDARPAITGTLEHPENYDAVFLGYPIWWGEAPRIISTFLESYDFSGKTIVPFCTSASDSIDNSLHIFSELCPEATLAEGLTANDEADIEPWLQGLGLLP